MRGGREWHQRGTWVCRIDHTFAEPISAAVRSAEVAPPAAALLLVRPVAAVVGRQAKAGGGQRGRGGASLLLLQPCALQGARLLFHLGLAQALLKVQQLLAVGGLRYRKKRGGMA